METAFVTLHVGLDTFRPVSEQDPTEHTIHTEYYELPAETAAVLTRARARGPGQSLRWGQPRCGRWSRWAGTEPGRRDLGKRTSLRRPAGRADLFILPGHEFRLVDGMITNFHLPRSTLLMLVSAFAGRERILAAYREAIEQRYRFYSFGDAMLIW